MGAGLWQKGMDARTAQKGSNKSNLFQSSTAAVMALAKAGAVK
jgi:hypothetical protein